jgi:hypothetical protein
LPGLNRVGGSSIELAVFVVLRDFSINLAEHPVIDRARYLVIIENGEHA